MRTIESCAPAEIDFYHLGFLTHLTGFLVKHNQVLNAETFFPVGITITPAESCSGSFYGTGNDDLDGRFDFVNLLRSYVT